MYITIKTTPQEFLKQIGNFVVSNSLKSDSMNQRRLALKIISLFYPHFVKIVPQFKKLVATLLKNYSDSQIILILKKDNFQRPVFLKDYFHISDSNIDPYLYIGFWNLHVLVEKSDTENIWLYTSQYIKIPFIKEIAIPENFDSEYLLSNIRENISLIVKKVYGLDSTTSDVNIEIIPVKIPPLIVAALKNEKDVSIDTLNNIVLELGSKYKNQIVSLLKENSEDFIEILASYIASKIKDNEISLPDPIEVYEAFIDSYEYAVKSKFDNILVKVSRQMEKKIDKMNLEELEYYNDERTIYDELMEIYNNINFPYKDIEEDIVDFIYTKFEIIYNIKYYIEEYLFEFTEVDLDLYSKKNSSIRDSAKKIRIIQYVLDKLYILFSEREEALNYNRNAEIFRKLIEQFSFSNIYEEFLEFYGVEKIKSALLPKVREKLELYLDAEVQNLAKEVVNKILEDLDYYVTDALNYMVDEVKELIEERLREYEDDEE